MTPGLLLYTDPLNSGHAGRGIGAYTRELLKQLQSSSELKLIQPQQQELLDEVDIIHYPYFDLFSNSLPIIKNKPRVVTVHDVIPLIFAKHYPVGLKGKINFYKQKLALKNCEAIITDSIASKRDIVNFLGISDQKIHVVQLAAGKAFQKPSPEILNKTIKKYSLPNQYLLYVGDINYNKNIPALINSLQYISDDTKLVLVGKNFRAQAIPEWQAIATELNKQNFSSRVQILSEVDEVSELAAIYHHAVCYVQPSLYEGFGLPVLEALACETLVVTTQNSSLIEVGGSVVEFADQANAKNLATAINKVLSLSSVERKKRILAGRDWAQRFSWKKTATKTIKVYKSVLAES
jgi:glycosyltransferase involved in cell wall biosynthesis